MLRIGETPVAALRLGEMGIKTACVGEEPLYTRPGGYLYLELTATTNEEEEDQWHPTLT